MAQRIRAASTRPPTQTTRHRLHTAALVAVACLAWQGASAQTARPEVAYFDARTRELYIPELLLDQQHKLYNVWVRLTDLGTASVNDATAGTTAVRYDNADQRLRLPRVELGDTPALTQITLLRPAFVLLRADGVPIDSGQGGPATLVVQIEPESPGTTPRPVITLTHMHPPASEAAFCADASLRQLLLTPPPGHVMLPTTLTTCSFDGTTGRWGAVTYASPTIRMPYTTSFTYYRP